MSPRCEYCKIKKVSIIPFTCKCVYKALCEKCRYPEEHKCTFDYRNESRISLEKSIPKVIGDKVEKI